MTSDDETNDYASSHNGSDDGYSAYKKSESDDSSLYNDTDDDLTSDVEKSDNESYYASSHNGTDDDVSIKVSSDDEEYESDTGSGTIDYQQQLQEYKRLRLQQQVKEKLQRHRQLKQDK